MKYSEMVTFLYENNIRVMQPVIATEVNSQLVVDISEDEFEEICEEIYNTYLNCVADPDIDIWYLVDEELSNRGYKE